MIRSSHSRSDIYPCNEDKEDADAEDFGVKEEDHVASVVLESDEGDEKDYSAAGRGQSQQAILQLNANSPRFETHDRDRTPYRERSKGYDVLLTLTR